jgi:magnesium and cobalt transporter
MPDGDRTKYKFPTILGKIFSFFHCKHKHSHNHAPHSLSLEPEVIDSWKKYEKLKAEDIMIPRIDISALDYNSSLEEIRDFFLKNRHTRLPVFKEDLDNIASFINVKDILPYLLNPKENPNFKIDLVLRPLLIISPSMKIINLLEKMRQTRTHIALVVDEFGGTDGLITIEDLVEEIIGEIEDEHDTDPSDEEFKEINPKCFEASGRMEINDLEDKLNLSLDNNDSAEKYDTLGGLIISIYGHIPQNGSKILHPNNQLVFEIIDSDPRRIKRVLIHKN